MNSPTPAKSPILLSRISYWTTGHGADPNLNFFRGGALLAIFWCQIPPNIGLIEKILDKGGQINGLNFQAAMRKEKVDILELMLEYGPQDRFGWREGDRKSVGQS